MLLRLPAILLCCLLVVLANARAADDPPPTGPETENRFPSLKVPPGFKATLFACDPLIEYPSAISIGPRPGTLFVAVDYMTGLGTEIVRRDEIRLIADSNGDGYADKATVYAAGFNSIQGLAYHEGTVFVMHSPFLTALRDTDGDGVADERRDLLTGLGLPPEENPPRLHCANGVVVGHDGWLYLALGDHGCNVLRPEGDRLVLEGGGILRCRPDGRDLHVFATGLRNIYDIALDEELNVFVRDNENDGGDYKIRVCHSFFGADHGYPYLYYERPDEALPPLADLGLGSSAGGVCYMERQFPREFYRNLFFCEWGRSVVRYRPEPRGSSFAPLEEIEFAAGADNDPYGFKPTDLVVDRDGSLIISDWADGQRPRRGRGRIYRIAYRGSSAEAPAAKVSAEAASSAVTFAELMRRLDSESYYERLEAQAAIERLGRDGLAPLRRAFQLHHLGPRARLHAVWILAHVEGRAATNELLTLARTDPDTRVQALAIRAVGDLNDPVLLRHRLDAGRGDLATGERVADLCRSQDPRVQLEAIVALGRLRLAVQPLDLRDALRSPDPTIAHAAMQAFRRSEHWPSLLALLDQPGDPPIRLIALRAIADRAEPVVVDGLMKRLGTEPLASRRREYADLLTRVHKKPGPWVYWGYRPPPRPPNSVAWERTEAIEQTLDRVLADADRTVRLATLRRMQREKIPTRLATLVDWLAEERDAERVAGILESLREHLGSAPLDPLGAVVRDPKHATPNRLVALAMFAGRLTLSNETRLLELAGQLEDGPVLADSLRQLSKTLRRVRETHPGDQVRFTHEKANALLIGKCSSPDAEVRAAAIDSLVELGAADAARGPVCDLLSDADPRVRRAAATAMGKMVVSERSASLLVAALDTDPGVRRASIESLRLLREPRVLTVAVAALTDHETELAALECIAALGSPKQAAAITELAKRNPSAEILPRVVQTLTKWRSASDWPGLDADALDRAVAELQGSSGMLVRWTALGPLRPESVSGFIDRLSQSGQTEVDDNGGVTPWVTAFAAGSESRVSLAAKPGDAGAIWLCYADVDSTEEATVQCLASSNGTLRVWLNGRAIHQRDQPGNFQPDSDRFDAALGPGLNRFLVQVASAKWPAEFQLRFRRRGSNAEREQLAQAALTRPGNAERGRKLFFDTEKSQCVKCHRMGEQGERIGPELTGVGSRFSRIHIVESILEPSRTIAPSFETVAVALKNGRVLSGVRIAQTEQEITLADNQGQKHVIARSDIDEQRQQPLSTMPDGLEKRLTLDEFVDLVAFLTSQKQERKP